MSRLSAAPTHWCPSVTQRWQEGVRELCRQGGSLPPLAKGVSPSWAGRWHDPDMGVITAGPAPAAGQRDTQLRAGRAFWLGSALSHPPSTFKP